MRVRPNSTLNELVREGKGRATQLRRVLSLKWGRATPLALAMMTRLHQRGQRQKLTVVQELHQLREVGGQR